MTWVIALVFFLPAAIIMLLCAFAAWRTRITENRRLAHFIAQEQRATDYVRGFNDGLAHAAGWDRKDVVRTLREIRRL